MDFWKTQTEALRALRVAGIQLPLAKPIPVFKMWVSINRLALAGTISPRARDYALDALERILECKVAEIEPKLDEEGNYK